MKKCISIKYKGRGHGSAESCIIALIFVIGIIIFLALAGLFTIQTSIINVEKLQDNISLNFNRKDFLIVTTQNVLIQAELRDGSMKKIGQSVTFLQGAQCIDVIENLGLSSSVSLNLSYCLPGNLDLSFSSSIEQIKSLNIFTNLSSIVTVELLFLNSNVNENQIITDLNQRTHRIYNSVFTMVQIQIISNDKEQMLNYGITSNKLQNQYEYELKGMLFKVKDRIVTLEKENDTIFKVIGNAWAFSVIMFSVFLVKISKILNKREKVKSIPQEKEMSKSNIIFLLLKMESFENSKKENELSKIKCYVKKDI